MLILEFVEQQGQCTCNFTLRRLRVSTVTVKKQQYFPFIFAGMYVVVNNASVPCVTAFKNGFHLQ